MKHRPGMAPSVGAWALRMFVTLVFYYGVVLCLAQIFRGLK